MRTLQVFKAIFVISVMIAVFSGCDPLDGSVGDDGVPSTLPQEVRDFVVLMNDHREDIGLSRLIWDDQVYLVALSHSEDMKNRDFFDHVNPDGKDPFERLSDAGIDYLAAAENIAMGYSSGEDVLTGWLNSPGHRTNIENSNYTHHGLGYVAEGHYWTHLFINPPD